jgi:rhomboid protease GluP
MENHERRSMLCPNCRKLISLDEPSCPYCGLRAPGSRWRKTFSFQGLLRGDQLTRSIMYLCGGMFILSLVMNPASTGFSMNPFSFLSPGNESLFLLGATGTYPIDQFHRWWTVVAAIYLHGSILHILFNMMAFNQIAPFIVQEYGTSRMVSIFTLSGIGGYLASYFAGIPFTLGASGAVCGLIGAALYYGKSRGGAFGQMVYRQVGGWALGIFMFGFLVPGINNWAHGGGLLFGALTGALLGYQERFRESSVHQIVAAICVVATLGILIWAVGSAFVIFFLSRGR